MNTMTIVDTPAAAYHRSGYRCDSVPKAGRKNLISEISFKSTKSQSRRSSSYTFKPIGSSMKTSRLAALSNANELFNCTGSNEYSTRNFANHIFHPDVFTGEVTDDSEEFFLVPPTQSCQHYFHRSLQEVSNSPASDTIDKSRVGSVRPETHTCYGEDYRDHSSENCNEVARLTSGLYNTKMSPPRARKKFFLKPRFQTPR